MSSLDKIIEAGNLFTELTWSLPLCLGWCIYESAAGVCLYSRLPLGAQDQGQVE